MAENTWFIGKNLLFIRKHILVYQFADKLGIIKRREHFCANLDLMKKMTIQGL